MGDKATTQTENTKTGNPNETTGKTNQTPSKTNQSSENNQTAQTVQTAQAAKTAELDEESRAKIADYDNLKSRAESAESRLRVLEAKDAFTESAAKMKAKNPAKVFALVGAQIEFDEKGNPKNLDDVLKRAKERFPEEFGAVSTSIDAGEKGVETVGRSVDDFIRGALR